MGKIIINIQDDLDPDDAVRRVANIISEGRISNNGNDYCYVTTWVNGTTVTAKRNKKSDTFTVFKTNSNDTN